MNVKQLEDKSVKEDIANAVKPRLKKNMDDDSFSMSISVVRGDEPMPFASEPDDSDVTVTRISHGSGKEKPFQDPISSSQKSRVSSAEGVIQSKVTVSGEKNKSAKIVTFVDTPQLIPLKTNTCEKQASHVVKMDGSLGLTGNSEKEVNETSPEKLGTVSSFKTSSDASMEFIGLPNMQGKIKSKGIKKKAKFDDIVLNEPQKPTLEPVHVKDTVPVSSEKGIKKKAKFDDIVLNEPQKPTLELVHVKDTVPISSEKKGNKKKAKFEDIVLNEPQKPTLEHVHVKNTIPISSEKKGIKKKAKFEDIVLNEPQKPTLEPVHVKDTVPISSETQSVSDEVTKVTTVPNLGGVCNTVTPTQRKRISICVDNKCIRTCPSLGVTPAVNNEATDSVTENLQKIKVKQQRPDGSSSGNVILAGNENKLDGNASKNVQISEVDRTVQNHVKATNVSGKDTIKKFFVDLPAVMTPTVTTMNSISAPTLKKDILQCRSSDIKYVVCDNSISKFVPASVSSGNKVGYHIVTSNRGGRSGNALSCSDVAVKTAAGQKETLAPLYFAIVSSANVHAAGTANSSSANKVSIVAAVRNSNQQTNQTRPQVRNSVCPAML
jgi:ubiquitin